MSLVQADGFLTVPSNSEGIGAGEKVNIEIFHHPTHTYNIDRFVKSVKHSIDYFNDNYGPYQYRATAGYNTLCFAYSKNHT